MYVTGLAEFGDAIEAGAVLVDDVSNKLCGVFRGTDGGADDAGTGVAAAFLADVDAGGVDDVDLAVHSGELGGVDWAALRSQEYVDLLDGELRVQPQALLQLGSVDVVRDAVGVNVPNGGGRERLFDDWLDTHVLIKYYLPILYLGNEALKFTY